VLALANPNCGGGAIVISPRANWRSRAIAHRALGDKDSTRRSKCT
jgi:hypothetical protein